MKGDTENQNNLEYPNLADVPQRPDPSISLEEQDNIVKNLENNSQLQPVPSETVVEKKVFNIETTFNDTTISKKKYNGARSYVDGPLRNNVVASGCLLSPERFASV